MKNKFSAILLLAVLFALPSKAQQNAMFSQYMFNTLAYNPAYAGSRNLIGATALFRNQWTGMPGAPKTGTLSVDAPFLQNRVGAGLQFVSDKLGVTGTNAGAISGAYRIGFQKGILAFGMQASLTQYYADYSSVPLDPSGLANDPAFTNDVSMVFFNAGTGLFYSTQRFYLGLSAQDLIPNKLNDQPAVNNEETARQSMHAFLATGYVFPLGMDYNLKTSVLFKGVKGAPLQADLNATVWIKDFIAIGAEYRTSADISALMELKATNRIRIGYAYDRSTTNLKSYNSGSHEFMLRYEIPFDRSRVLSPRYF